MSFPGLLRAVIGIAAASAIVGLAGCAPEPIEPVELEPLSCVDASWNGGPDRTAVVDCTSPHQFDIVGSLGEWDFDPATYGASDVPAGEIYSRLVRAEEGDQLAADYLAWAEPQCDAALRDLLGLSVVAVGDATAEQLTPRVNGRYAVIASLSTRTAYELGDRTTLCSVAWLGESGGLAPISWPAGVGLRALAGPGLELGQRECFLYDNASTLATDCTSPHSGQVIVDVDARAALGDEWVAGVDPSTGQSDDWLAADAACEQLLSEIVPAGSLGDGRAGRAGIRPRDGWVGFDGTLNEDAGYPISCAVAVSGQAPLMEGDVWG